MYYKAPAAEERTSCFPGDVVRGFGFVFGRAGWVSGYLECLHFGQTTSSLRR